MFMCVCDEEMPCLFEQMMAKFEHITYYSARDVIKILSSESLS